MGKKTNAHISQLSSDIGDDTFEGIQLAEHIDNYFSDIGYDLASYIKERFGVDPDTGSAQGPLNINSDGITNKIITIDNLEYFLKKINVDKSSSVPDI